MAIAAVQAAARRYGVGLKDHDAVMASVAVGVERIAGEIETSRKDGTLADFNAEFQRRRLEAQKRGQRFPTYAPALAKFDRAHHDGGSDRRRGGAIFAKVFGCD